MRELLGDCLCGARSIMCARVKQNQEQDQLLSTRYLFGGLSRHYRVHGSHRSRAIRCRRDASIKIGNTAPYSGPASAYGTIARAEAAYFQMLNDQGGINGRKIEFDTSRRRLFAVEDGRADPQAGGAGRGARDVQLGRHRAQHLRAEVPEHQEGAAAVRVVQARRAGTIRSSSRGRSASIRPTSSKAGSTPKSILKTKPDAKIAVITPNEDAGKDYLKGFKDGLGEHVGQIVAETTYLTPDPTIDSQMVTMREIRRGCVLRRGDAEIRGASAAQGGEHGLEAADHPADRFQLGLRGARAGWARERHRCRDRPLSEGPDRSALGRRSGQKEFSAWMKKYQPNASPGDLFNVQGYTVAQVMTAVLKNCNGDYSRDNIIKQATNLKALELPMLLPGIKVQTEPDNVTPIRQIQMARFDGKSWALFGDVLSDQ